VRFAAGTQPRGCLFRQVDIVYVCRGNGGLSDVSAPTTLAQATTININVQSALQASYAGPRKTCSAC
jgi:hypothetical protein